MFTDSSSQPKVTFLKNLLTMSDKSNVSSVTAYLTVPQHHLVKDCANCTPGLISSKSGDRSQLPALHQNSLHSINNVTLVTRVILYTGILPVLFRRAGTIYLFPSNPQWCEASS